MISALGWLPKGAAKAVPTVTQISDLEMEALKAQLEGQVMDDDEMSSQEDEDEDEDIENDSEAKAISRAKAVASSFKADQDNNTADAIEKGLKELDMDNYDNSDDEDNVANRVYNSTATDVMYAAGEKDPYITKDDDSESEVEDFTIKDSDLVLLCCKNEDEVSNLEIWIYEEYDNRGEGNLYVHHDILLPSFPLCLEWLNFNPCGSSDKRNLVAVGTMDTSIEIWDLDILDNVEPVTTLGGKLDPENNEGDDKSSKSKDKKKKDKKKKKKVQLVPGSHEDSVLSLSWNRDFRNVLASGSADTCVKVWDLATQKCEYTLKHHQDKVQAVCWNPKEASVLLTGAFDRNVCLTDARSPTAKPVSWTIDADVEAVDWDPHTPTCFAVSMENGAVNFFDARGGAGSKPLHALKAHKKAACALSYNPAVSGLFATGSTDKTLRLWDLRSSTPMAPILSHDVNAGAIFTAKFCPEAPYLIAVGGSNGEAIIWDVRFAPAVEASFGSTHEVLKAPAVTNAVAAAEGDGK